jgi:hypothetical protein
METAETVWSVVLRTSPALSSCRAMIKLGLYKCLK